MHDERRLVEGRLRRELRERIKPAVHGRRVLLDSTAYDLPGEPVPIGDLEDADGSFASIAPGTPWGRPWGTTWFRATGTAPSDWTAPASDLIVELGFSGAGPGFQAEGLVYVDGLAVRGIHPRRRSLSVEAAPGAPISVLVEAAANPDFNGSHRPNPLGSLATAGAAPLYVFGGIWLAERHSEVEGLVRDLEVLGRLMTSLPDSDARRHRITRAIEAALDALDLAAIDETATAARAELAPALAVPARAGAHRIFAVGHAHIDTAWLWPLRETERKCARTFANAVELMDRYPEYQFACSQAAQYEWIERRHPELFERIRAKVAAGQWIPVGGMWVEADMNLPSGESIVRQLVHGQRYFESRFGARSSEVWIPDVFGYPGSLPQIFAAGGCDNFVTQKLSWNKQNKMPHNTFWWEGIDGTRVMTHFPPVDTYNAEMQADENAFAAANFSDKAWSSASIMPYGYGNGGGGPTAEMVERARRMADLDGVPTIELRSPDEYFELVRGEAEAAGAAAPVWRGELYFEMHRGTFTSQTKTKVGNRTCERLLREVELYWALIGDAAAYRPVQAELDQLWKDVLVQQFHDIIPGSSIAWVHQDAEAAHARVVARLEALIADALDRLIPSGVALVANAASHFRREVVIIDADVALSMPTESLQRLDDGRIAVIAEAPALSVGALGTADADWFEPVIVEGSTMDNGYLRVTWDDTGRLVSIIDLRQADEDGSPGRELIIPGRFGAELTIAPDHPVEYDAWDVERWTARRAVPIAEVDEIRIDAAGPLVAEVTVVRTFGAARASRVSTTYRLAARSRRLDVSFDIDWREDEKLLAVEFPLDVHTPMARCGIQFGHVERPRHENTSWDLAKFEVCAHRWVDVSEPSFGVAILNDARYGHSVHGDSVRVTLLRAANYPDPAADRGRHRTTVAVFPHDHRLGDVVREAENLNLPLRVQAVNRAHGTATPPWTPPEPATRDLSSADRLGAPGTRTETSTRTTTIAVFDLITSLPGGVEVSAVKLADDGSGDLIIRLAENCGDRHRFVLHPSRELMSATIVDLLEDPVGAVEIHSGGVVVDVRPFQLLTLRLRKDAFVASGMETGIREGYERLDEVLADLPT